MYKNKIILQGVIDDVTYYSSIIPSIGDSVSLLNLELIVRDVNHILSIYGDETDCLDHVVVTLGWKS